MEEHGRRGNRLSQVHLKKWPSNDQTEVVLIMVVRWLIMVALCNRADHYIFALWFLSSFYLLSIFFFFLFLAYSQQPQVGCLPYFDTWCGPSANLECRFKRRCTRLAANVGPKKVSKNRHLGTIPQLCRAISSQLWHVSTIRKKLVKQQYLLYMSPQYGELRSTSGWDRFVSLAHPS